jgi:hypothetical protein
MLPDVTRALLLLLLPLLMLLQRSRSVFAIVPLSMI